MIEKYIFGDVLVFTKDELPKSFNLHFVFKKFQELVPNHLSNHLDAVYIGQFDFLNDKQYTATYKDGAIYVTNEQTNEKDMVQDLVHEVSHMIEENNMFEVYGDKKLEVEFLQKRRNLFDALKTYDYNVSWNMMNNVEYDENLDHFLAFEIGYEKANDFVNGIFNSPYAATSLREYFARGFEEFLMGDRYYLNKISPQLYAKLEQLVYPDEV